MIFLGIHSRLTDVACHTEICQWQGFPVAVLFQAATMPLDCPTRSRPLNLNNQGSGQAFLHCVAWAKELGVKRMIYSNGDDWLFNKAIRQHMLDSPAEFMAYNWFGCDNMDNFALNEVVLDVDKFAPFLPDGWRIFGTMGCVETDLAAWVKLVNPTFERHPNREKPCGIGTTFQSSPNSRFFNRAWGMLGYHDLDTKRRAYHRICKESYMAGVDTLEAMPHFQKWLRRMDICDCKEGSWCPHLCKKLIGRLYELAKCNDSTYRDKWREDCKRLGKRPTALPNKGPCGCKSIVTSKPA